MSDRKPVVIAVMVGSLALAANGAAAVIAISSNSPPEAAAFGIIGLTAAFAGLIMTMLWAWRGETARPQPRRERVFTPWQARVDVREPVLLAEPRASRALARAIAPTPQPVPVAAPTGDVVIYLEEWLKARAAQHAGA